MNTHFNINRLAVQESPPSGESVGCKAHVIVVEKSFAVESSVNSFVTVLVSLNRAQDAEVLPR
jgi:hypothetical protein